MEGNKGLGNVPMVDASSSESGRIGIHPGSIRKSGKQRACGIQNLEEGTEDGRSAIRKLGHSGYEMET